jgi:transcription initiation factor TFIID subunit 9
MAARSVPKDALINQAILKEMGVVDYEPRLLNQMLEFTYRYVSDILEDAKVYSQHANKKNIDSDDVKLAVQCKLDHAFTNPPPRDLLLDIARHKNATPLPLIKPFTGPRLPPDRYCLTTPNFRLRPYKKPTKTGSLPMQKFTISQGSIAKSQSGPGPTLTLITKANTTPTFTVKPALSSAAKLAIPMPIIRLTPGTSAPPTAPSFVVSTPAATTSQLSMMSTDGASLKRKREDDSDAKMDEA